MFRSRCTGFKEDKMEKTPVLDPCTIWEASMVTEEQIQSLADCGLLRPKSQVGWRPAAGEEFPTEGTGETLVFLAHIERGFGVPAGTSSAASSTSTASSWYIWCRTQSPSSPPSSTSVRLTSASRHISTCGATSSS
jgi:hypothetical protein